jgi:hypothetical protein
MLNCFYMVVTEGYCRKLISYPGIVQAAFDSLRKDLCPPKFVSPLITILQSFFETLQYCNEWGNIKRIIHSFIHSLQIGSLY